MAKLTSANLTDTIEGVHLSKRLRVSPDAESKKDKVFKNIDLDVNFEGLTFNDLLALAMRPVIVDWQNGGSGRKNFDKLVDKSTVKVSAKSPGVAPQIDPIDAVIASAKASGMSVEEYLRSEVAKRGIK